MSEAQQTVYILDDDEAMRDALQELFCSEGIQTRCFVSAEAFLRWDNLWKGHGCAIVDIHMPGMTGLELLADLKQKNAKISVIIITGQGDVAKAVTALKAGAVDFIEKPFDPAVLVKTVKKVLLGVGPKKDQAAELARLQALELELTVREREVMHQIAAGNSNKAIALKLNISARTVETHRAKMMEKMKYENVSSLVSAVLRLQATDE